MNSPSEERVMRAREVLARHCKVPGPDLDFVLNGERDNCVAAMLAFSDEGSGIGELREAGDGWLPIEQAPKDGRYIDVARFMDDFGWIVGVAYWVKDLGGGWISKGTGPFGELGLAHPTHWQLRPSPPDIDLSGLAQEVEQSRDDKLLADDLDYVAGKPVE